MEFVPIESLPTISRYISCKVLLCMPAFGRISSAKLCHSHPIRPPAVWRLPRGSKMILIEMSTPHSYSTSIHTIGLFYVVSHNTQRGRQSNWNRSPIRRPKNRWQTNEIDKARRDRQAQKNKGRLAKGVANLLPIVLALLQSLDLGPSL